jgi:hypothetical protein
MYEEGMDIVRWYEGIGAYGTVEKERPQEVWPVPTSSQLILFAIIGAVVLIFFVSRWSVRKKSLETAMGSFDEKAVSPIVAEVMLIAIITVAMSAIAMAVLSQVVPRVRHAEIQVRLENANPTPTDTIRVILYHVGGDALGIPQGPEDEFRVIGRYLGVDMWENVVPWDNWWFSDEADGFEFGENAIGYLRHDDASVYVDNTKINIVMMDLYTDEWIFDGTLVVENSFRV